ncbi:MAG: hypothetical protein QOD50_874 [Actinomycetota bacterium]|jgi:hypothetical protein|nr:hypothetical protein [Actinomycetota bacterium]
MKLIIGIVCAALVVGLGLVLVLGLANGPDRTNPGASPTGSAHDPGLQDPLSGAEIVQITNVSAIEAHCQGKNACWLWRIVAKRSCVGSVSVDFYTHAHDDAEAESVTVDVRVHANQPAYVTVSSTDFTEHDADISQYDC